MTTRKQTLAVTLFVLAMLSLAALACYSDSPLVARTATPTASPTLPPTPDIDTDFRVGDTVLLSGGFQLYLMNNPEPDTGDVSKRQRASCFLNPPQRVQVLDIAVDAGVVYYQVDCGYGPGWASEDHIAAAE